MIRRSYEEIVWEAYQEKGRELLDELDTAKRDILQRVFGIFPYKQHSITEIAESLAIPYSTAHSRYRKAIRTLKDIVKNRFKQ